MQIIPQLWYCEKCGVIAVKMFHQWDGVWEVSQAIKDQHMKQSPGCDAGLERVVVPSNITEDQILFDGRK